MGRTTTRTAVPAGARRRSARGAAAQPESSSRNEVVLVGRVSGEPEERELPSGDVLVAWRLVVERPPARRPPPGGVRLATVDTLSCVAWSASTRRTAGALRPGDVVEVVGALRQRFWKAGAALASRTEVEAEGVRRLGRAP